MKKANVILLFIGLFILITMCIGYSQALKETYLRENTKHIQVINKNEGFLIKVVYVKKYDSLMNEIVKYEYKDYILVTDYEYSILEVNKTYSASDVSKFRYYD